MEAILAKGPDLELATKVRPPALILSLVAANISPLCIAQGGWTALMFAVRSGHLDIVAKLLAAGAQSDVIDKVCADPDQFPLDVF